MKSPKMFWWKMRKKLGSPKLLCDTCKNDYHTVCLNPRRPNATECADYEKR
ncbi:MAG: PHD finger domain-containing protein [Candidatus Geothermincolia bacterium]